MTEAAKKLLLEGKFGEEGEMDPAEKQAALAYLSDNLRSKQSSPNMRDNSPARSHLSRIGQSFMDSPDVIRIGHLSPRKQHSTMMSDYQNYI